MSKCLTALLCLAWCLTHTLLLWGSWGRKANFYLGSWACSLRTLLWWLGILNRALCAYSLWPKQVFEPEPWWKAHILKGASGRLDPQSSASIRRRAHPPLWNLLHLPCFHSNQHRNFRLYHFLSVTVFCSLFVSIMKVVMSVAAIALGLVGLAAAGTKQHAGEVSASDPSGNWATARQGGGGYGGGWVR